MEAVVEAKEVVKLLEVVVGRRKMAASWVVAAMTAVVAKVGEAKVMAGEARGMVAEVRVMVGEVRGMVAEARAKVGEARASKAEVMVKSMVAAARGRVESESLHPGPQATHQRRSQNARRALGRLCR